MTHSFTFHLVEESDLTDRHHERICRLLVKAFPQYADLFSTASHYYALPEYRLWMEDEQGQMVAHLDFERRIIGVNGVDVYIAGVGEVATHPDWQGHGVGRLLMQQLQSTLYDQFTVAYGFLQCRDEVVGYYEKVGWHQVNQLIHEEDVHSGKTVVSQGPAMILPIHQTVDEWMTDGSIDLRGLPW